MLKMAVKYLDFNDNERVEDFYFNLTRVEFMRWQAQAGKDLVESMREAVTNNDFNSILKYFEELIKRSYGVKSDDGRHFIKDSAKTRDFMNSSAYDELFWRLSQSPEETKRFIEGVVPKTLSYAEDSSSGN